MPTFDPNAPLTSFYWLGGATILLCVSLLIFFLTKEGTRGAKEINGLFLTAFVFVFGISAVLKRLWSAYALASIYGLSGLLLILGTLIQFLFETWRISEILRFAAGIVVLQVMLGLSVRTISAAVKHERYQNGRFAAKIIAAIAIGLMILVSIFNMR